LNCVNTRFQISTWPKAFGHRSRCTGRRRRRALDWGVGGPEILVFAQPLQAVRRQLHVAEPNLRRLVVVQIDRGGEQIGIHPHPFLAGEEFPGPVDRVAFEVVAEAEVAQHLEEGVMVGRAADVVDVARPQAFLAGGCPGEFQLAAAEEVVLELVHAGGGEEHRRSQRGPARRWPATQPFDSKKAR